MTQMIDCFRKFYKVVMEERLYEDPSSYFIRICNSIGIEPKALDEFIISELGIDGDELLMILYKKSSI